METHETKITKIIIDVYSTSETEARGLKEAINWFGRLRFFLVSIELDCKQVVDGSSNNHCTNSMLDAILNGCKTSLLNYQNFKISFIMRQANNVVYLLARATSSIMSIEIRFEKVSHGILHFLLINTHVQSVVITLVQIHLEKVMSYTWSSLVRHIY